ncbi:NADH:ubiquinone reductase (Na(+)-transporting) subunit F [Salegentibacter mishustinae]|jgi:Na+-transporting NADH:ubiquinone oxidoreductase subunit F|uniref:Na(+)-translocating NADH-quinone reductase subunit F n=1 Tax=Salegentibacter mishustinae TaxID=270918 RepID=A0A0Q9ZC75_9FLAO|nr:NADH:ubiquinone reductase (Na(+)-transporting) subunit F [Salegentibacter mishustinae]KRG30608.1 Na(+)-translocating NADH-quinone reductase subunit F [Salegentibacter mishustinae]PNW23497.1 Na(+)-translocating NADH-quinone reductase subunit F [Salegentibacter mishustinae]PZX66573.1 Na+-transporting NADH:ubiquinone oxidoreductase subunit F [Salegentibacter mishustinae]GGW83265.1 Na(+)-translocating NADH-quinone reductase subunit F [Salegentibacter mishustinae]|tara:strand:+ start:868 stop:2154 length:1287 start_codon:yes stop_codon:yes gene_type:complete
MTVIIASVVVFLALILILVSVLLGAKAKLAPSGPVTINVNGERDMEVGSGGTLLSTLGDNKLFLPSACGGGGTCVQCKCIVKEGGGAILPTEEPHFTRKEIAQGWRLGCQVKVKEDMKITIPEEVFGIKKWEATVVRNYNVASFIKEFVVEIPEDMDYKAGGYIQIEIPKCEVKFSDMDITAHPEEHDTPDMFEEEWDKFKLRPLVMKNPETVERAYSMASYPAEGREIMLNVRVATPPWDRSKDTWMAVNPGIASSYIFSRKKGDKVIISGPYGEFFINHSEAEMLYVGGGAGMAPMRSHLYHLFRTLKTGRKVTYWYGGRSKRELFYIEHFRALERDFPNFKFYLALSEPMEEDNWKVKKSLDDDGDGFVGFIHQVVIDNYLSHHEEPEDIELYFCGPPLMNKAVQKMGEDFGMPPENIRFDDFGG